MAIDDNKLYDLKGSQLKDLSAKVKAKADQADTYTKTEVDGLIPDVSGFATKTELSEGLADKADADTTYTKTEVDTALATKANTSTTYTKTEVDTALSAKADTATTYTKTEVDDLIDANKEVLVAVYEQTSYADVKDAIDAHKAIVLDMPANNNQFCMTFSTYTNGGDVIMYAIFKMSNDRSTLMTVTLTPQNQWRISHTDLQDKLVSGTSIKTVNNQSLLGSGNIDIQGTGNANLTVDTTNDFAVIQSQTQGMSFDLSDADGVTVIASDPGTYQNTKVLATQDYVDSKAGVHFAVDQETWYGTYTDENNVTYQVYTKTIFIPALPSAAGVTTYPIGVTNMKQIISISGVTTDGFVLNAPRQTVTDNITIYQVSKGSQTFSIEVGKDRSNKSAYVTIIYAKNN